MPITRPCDAFRRAPPILSNYTHTIPPKLAKAHVPTLTANTKHSKLVFRCVQMALSSTQIHTNAFPSVLSQHPPIKRFTETFL